jgi:hypothetical protein
MFLGLLGGGTKDAEVRPDLKRYQLAVLRMDPDPNPDYVFGTPGSGSGSISQRYRSGSFYQQAKIVRKTLIPAALSLIFDFLTLKIDVNVPSKSNNQKSFFLNLFFVGVLKVNDENSRIRIRFH